jgi:urease beta subunit
MKTNEALEVPAALSARRTQACGRVVHIVTGGAVRLIDLAEAGAPVAASFGSPGAAADALARGAVRFEPFRYAGNRPRPGP